MTREHEVVVDRRSLWVILLSRSRKTVLAGVGALIYWVVVSLPLPEGLTPQGQKALGAFALCVFFWVLNVLPLMITSLMAIILLPLSGVMQSSQAYALFGNE